MDSAAFRPEATQDIGVCRQSTRDRCRGQGHVDRYAAHLCNSELLGGLQQCGWVGLLLVAFC